MRLPVGPIAVDPRAAEALGEFFRQRYPNSAKFNALLAASFKACVG